MKKPSLKLMGAALLLFSAVLLTASLYLFILPPQYGAVARISTRADPVASVAPKAHAGAESGFGEGPWAPAEPERIQSKVVLFQVISNLDLNRKWGEKFKEGELKLDVTYALLKKRLEVKRRRGSSMIEVNVTSDDPAEAASIANGIAQAYRQYKDGPRIVRGQTLEERLRRLDKEKMRAEERLDSVRKELGIALPDHEIAEPLELRESDRMSHYFNARKEVERCRKDIEFLSTGNLLERSESTIAADGPTIILEPAIAHERPLMDCGTMAVVFLGLAAVLGPIGYLLSRRASYVQRDRD